MSYKNQPRDKHGDFITVKKAARRKKNADFLRKMHLQRNREKELEAAVVEEQPEVEAAAVAQQPKVEPAGLRPKVRSYKMYSFKVQ